MRDKWVDLADYFGPDRRRRAGPKRWSDRRRYDETSELPPLGALLRRLRVHIIGVSTPDSRRRGLQLLNAAIHEAERQRLVQCAEALKQADAMLRTSAGDPADADAYVLAAIDHAAAGR